MKPLPIFLLHLSAAFLACAPAKSLRTPASFQPGYKLAFQQKDETEMVMDVFGENQYQRSTNTTEYEHTLVKKLSDGRLQWDLVVTRFVMENEDVTGNISVYDSDAPNPDTSNMQHIILGSMIGHKMHMITKPDGQLLEFTGADALFDKMVESMASKADMAPLMTSIKASFGDTVMMEAVRNMWGDYPNKKMRVGEKWTETRIKPGMMSAKTVNSYQLKSRNATEAVLQLGIKSMPPPGKLPELDMGFAKIKYDLSGTGKGQIILSQPDGIIKHYKTKMDMKGNMHMKGEQIPDMTVPISFTTVVTISRI